MNPLPHRSSPAAGTPPWIWSYFRFALCLQILASLALEIISSFEPLRSRFWGFHLMAFLPWPVRLGLWGFSLLSLLILLKPEAAVGLMDRLQGRVRFGVHPALAWVLLLLGSAAVLWLGRAGHTLLGDGLPITMNLPSGELFHPRLPLAHLMLVGWYALVGPRHLAAGDLDPVRDVVAWNSMLWGVLFAVVAVFLGRLLVALKDEGSAQAPGATLAAALILVQGYAQLFFGYVEYYPVYAFLVGAYALTALLFLRRRVPFVVPVAVCLLLVAAHFSAAIYVPSLLVLAVLGLWDPGRRRGVLRDLAVGGVGVIGLDLALSRLAPGFGLWKGLRTLFALAVKDNGTGGGLAYAFSGRHLRDFANEQQLIGPLGAVLLAVAVFPWLLARGPRRAGAIVLLAAALCVLGASWFTTELTLGYARDWDVFAPGGVMLTVAGLALVLDRLREPRHRRAFLAAALLFSVAHTAAWVGVNRSEARSLARMAHLPLGLGREDLVIGNWHLRRGERAEARRSFELSLTKFSGNCNAHELLGILDMQDGRLDEAAASFARAAVIRPDKVDYRRELVGVLRRLGRFEEALPHYEAILRRAERKGEDYFGYGACLEAVGRGEEANALYRRGEAEARARLNAHPKDHDAWVLLGHMRLGQRDEAGALEAFQKAVTLRPTSEQGLLFTWAILSQTQRAAEAREAATRFLDAYPQHERAGAVRNWLNGAGR